MLRRLGRGGRRGFRNFAGWLADSRGASDVSNDKEMSDKIDDQEPVQTRTIPAEISAALLCVTVLSKSTPVWLIPICFATMLFKALYARCCPRGPQYERGRSLFQAET